MFFMSGHAQFIIQFFTHLNCHLLYKSKHQFFYQSNMDLYPVARYENIAERIKRLNNFNPGSAHSQENHNFPSPNTYRKQQQKRYGQTQSQKIQFTIKTKHQQKQNIAKTDIYEHEKLKNQIEKLSVNANVKQSKTIMKSSSGARQILQRLGSKKPNIQIKIEENDSSFTFMNQTQETNDFFQKVKSESSFRIDQILESYNKYKQNKQRFLQTVGNSTDYQSHEMNQSENCENIHEDQNTTLQTSRINIESKQNYYDEIILKQQKEQCIFQRTRKKQISKTYQNVEYQKDLQYLTQDNSDKRKSKSITKNMGFRQILAQRPINTEKTIVSIVSPRGTRIPGKICRNLDRTIVK